MSKAMSLSLPCVFCIVHEQQHRRPCERLRVKIQATAEETAELEEEVEDCRGKWTT